MQKLSTWTKSLSRISTMQSDVTPVSYTHLHHAKQITWKDYECADYIIGMDTANIRNLNRMLKNDPDGKVYKFLSFTGSGRDIADPWYTGDFEATYRDVVEGCNGFLAYLRREGKI